MIAAFRELVEEADPAYASFDSLRTLQLNLGNRCNQSCAHCHVDASPAGDRVMSRAVMERIVAFLDGRGGLTLDITGGSPEMNPHFRWFIEATRNLGPRRMVRTNLTVLLEPGMEGLPAFFRDQDLVVIASLPCHTQENVDRQRGTGVFARSITALRKLNELGYGDSLELDLVYNPGGDYLPGRQRVIEDEYRRELMARFGIRFSRLYSLANAPVGRFKEYLEAKGALEPYLRLLATSFNPDAAGRIMCRSQVSVDWEGFLYNCDFNQAMGLPIAARDAGLLKIDDLAALCESNVGLVFGPHCFMCTAGEGASCTGALVT